MPAFTGSGRQDTPAPTGIIRQTTAISHATLRPIDRRGESMKTPSRGPARSALPIRATNARNRRAYRRRVRLGDHPDADRPPDARTRSCSSFSSSFERMRRRRRELQQERRGDRRTARDAAGIAAGRLRSPVRRRAQRNRAAAEVQRPAALVADDFHAVRVAVRLTIADRHRQRRHVAPASRSSSSGEQVERGGFDQRLVALQVDDDIAVGRLRRDLGDAIGAGLG